MLRYDAKKRDGDGAMFLGIASQHRNDAPSPSRLAQNAMVLLGYHSRPIAYNAFRNGGANKVGDRLVRRDAKHFQRIPQSINVPWPASKVDNLQCLNSMRVSDRSKIIYSARYNFSMSNNDTGWSPISCEPPSWRLVTALRDKQQAARRPPTLTSKTGARSAYSPVHCSTKAHMKRRHLHYNHVHLSL